MKLYSLLKLVSDESRLKILFILSKSNVSVNEICSLTSLSQPNVSKHLKKLYEFEILDKQEVGKEVYFKLNREYVRSCKIFHPLIDAFEESDDGQTLLKKIKGE